MQKIELVNKLKVSKDESVLEEALKWCLFNYSTTKIIDEDSHYIYDKVVYYLMNSKNKVELWSKEEIEMIIIFFAHDLASKFKLEDKINFQILSKDNSPTDSNGACYDNEDGTYTIEYSYKVVEGFFMGKDVPLRAMQTIFHEVIHVIQNELIKGNLLGEGDEYYCSKLYIMTLELLTRKADKQFYDTNYEKLLKENHANKVGLQFAITYLKKYGPKFYALYNSDMLLMRMKYYDRNMNDAKITLYNKDADLFQGLDVASFLYINDHKDVLNKYPILKLVYNPDGTKKNIVELLQEREILLSTQKKETIDELYRVIANNKNFKIGGLEGTKNEIDLLIKYIEQTNTTDEFVYDLLVFRLRRVKLTEDKINRILSILKNGKSIDENKNFKI